MKRNTSSIGVTSTNEGGRHDAKLGSVHHVIITMGRVDNGNTSILLLLVIWQYESRKGSRFIDRQRTLGVEISNWGRGAIFEFGVWTVIFPKLRDNLGDGSKMG